MAEDGDGWTYVPKDKSRRPVNVGTNTHKNPPLRDCTLQQLQSSFERQLKRWQASSCRRDVLQLLDRQRPDGGWQIREAVCLASGSLSREFHAGRAQCQVAAFIDIVRYLQLEQEETIQVIAQEPQFTDLDKDLLSTLGISVLQHSHRPDKSDLGPAFQHIKSATFVFEPFMDASPELCRNLCASDPILYIGSSLRRRVIEGRSQPAADFVRIRGNRYFPRFEEDPNVFEGMSIWWKEPQDEDEEAS